LRRRIRVFALLLAKSPERVYSFCYSGPSLVPDHPPILQVPLSLGFVEYIDAPPENLRQPVTDPKELNELLAHYAQSAHVGIDTEADGMHSYREKLCLVQISDGARHELVDPLCDLDIGPLWEMVSRREIILHDCDFDLRMMRRTAGEGFQPGPIFDTMLAARFIGHPMFGLAALVEVYFGIVLEKGSQTADWSRRPLQDVMLKYAVKDVEYLPSMRVRMEEQLRELGRWEWYRQTLNRNITEALAERGPRDPGWWKVANRSRLAGRQLAILKEIWEWREGDAERVDVPPFRVLGAHQIEAIVRAADGGKPLPIPFKSRTRREGLEAAVQRGLQMPQEEWPRRENTRGRRPTPEEELAFERLKGRRDAVADAIGLERGLLASSAKLNRLSRYPEQEVVSLLPWQIELLGLNADGTLPPDEQLPPLPTRVELTIEPIPLPRTGEPEDTTREGL
jgi:ribonuclease D